MIKGEAIFVDRNTIAVKGENDAKEITFNKAVVATGSKPLELANVKYDGEVVIGSKEALQLQSLPEHLVVIGGGVVGMEIARLLL